MVKFIFKLLDPACNQHFQLGEEVENIFNMYIYIHTNDTLSIEYALLRLFIGLLLLLILESKCSDIG